MRKVFTLKLLICLGIIIFTNSNSCSAIERDLTELPAYLIKKGLTIPSYAPRSKDAIRGMAVLTYDLSDANVAAMDAQYTVAEDAERKGENDIALRIYWDLANRGCTNAILKLWHVFDEQQLGVWKNEAIKSFFVVISGNLRHLKETQKGILSVMVDIIKEWNAETEQQRIKDYDRQNVLERIYALEYYLRDPVVAERAKIIYPGILEVYPVLPLPPLESERRASGSSDCATSDGASGSTIAAPEAVELHELEGEIATGAGESAPLLNTEGLRRRLVGDN